jgi:GTPase SAR1 family protein
MGGQPEYQLVHQIFLPDTTVAVILFDPSRGEASLNEVRVWNKRVEKHLDKLLTRKILVGTKKDLARPNYTDPSISRLVAECEFDGFYYVSAKTGDGIPELRVALAEAVDWSKMLTTTRPELFQTIRDHIEATRQDGRVVLLMSELERLMQLDGSDGSSRDAIQTVARQLAQQGLVALSRVSGGDEAIVVRVAAVEMYAGSIILVH